MLKLKALNREASSDEDTPVIRREAQEEIALESYNKALRLQAQEVYLEAETILLKLIDENIPLLENNGGLPKSMSNLKYSCHVNIGNIYLKLNRVNDALERFLLASQLDSSDVTLWYKIGNLSLSEGKFRQSAYAFAKGLECTESHWPCLDKLISVLFAIRDTVACLEYIGKALILDPDYTKGLVLRRQIYRDNPATKEYYKLYNPDSIWEPPLNVSIDDEDEKTCLEEAQILIDRVVEAEKALAPKPLQTIALPKPLTDYTWLCLTETIIYIHQYLADKEMSHFTMFDMSKSMSNIEESSFKLPQSDVGDSKTVEDKAAVTKNPLVNGDQNVNEEEMNSEQIAERRFSQTSDTAMEVQEVTPVQTDNDEEQNTEQDNEDQDENVEPKERGRPRGSKRKRDLLSDLQTWGWYSRRKLSKKAKEKDFTIEDAFERIIPKDLLPFRIDPEKFGNFEESMNTMDLYNMYMQNENLSYLSPIHSPKSVNYEHYFGTDRERDDVQEFWTKERECIDAVILIKDLVFYLSKLWHYKWPKQLVPLYITAYKMFREHYDPPQVFCGGRSFEELRDDALASILFAELSVFSCDNVETIPPTLVGYMRLISGWDEKWKEEYPGFFIRVFWLQAHLFRKENNNDLAVNSLLLIQEAVEEEEGKRKEKYMLSLPNCFKYGLVNTEITVKILTYLDVINKLSTVENLYAAEKYDEVATILKSTFKGGPWPQIGRMGRPAQLGILIHSLWYIDMTQCFIWTEECLNESFDQHIKVIKDQDKWEKILEKCLVVLYEIIKTDTICVIDYLEESKRARIVQNMAKLISKQLNSDSARNPVICIVPWIILHFVLLREEQREYAKKRNSRGKKLKIDSPDSQEQTENTLPPSVAILFSAHEFLGPKGWCMTNQGELLHFIIDTILDKLDSPIFERLRDKIDIHIEQSMFCLYQHPSKKNKVSRHLADHNVDPTTLSWERACQLFEFYGPDCLPEYNSYKNVSISADLEQLFKRIIAQVPSNSSPQQHLPKIMDYIHGKSDNIMDPIEFPRKVKAIYYLIGDFYFKQREFSKCIKYFQMDLCINPSRLDSWACLGLSYAAQLDTKLNHCEKFKSEMEFLDKAKYANICFKTALEICADPLMLLIECGTFQYTVHSYCSRILKFESENLSMEKFEFLENQKNSYLDSSGNSFEKAIAIYEMEETNEADERWLQYYILGKIAEKKQKEPAEYLQYYLTANSLLEENKAEYPEKINYNNPQHLSVEALELHYRIHASVLKYLELHEGKDIPSTLGTFFKKCLSVSRYLKKPAPPPPIPVTPAPETVILAEPQESNKTSSSFQEQFLNALVKLGDPVEKEDENEISTNNNDKTDSSTKEMVQPKNVAENVKQKTDIEKDVIILSDSDDDIKVVENVDEEDKTTKSEKIETEENVDDKTQEKGTNLVEEENIITTEEEVNSKVSEEHGKKDVIAAEVKEKNPNDIEESQTKLDIAETNQEERKIEEMEVENTETLNNSTNVDNKVKDVQKLLDEMMMQTMQETDEFRSEADSDLSGTEKVEEVVVKDEQEDDNKVDTKKDEKIEEIPKKIKMDEEEKYFSNKRASVEASSSGSSSSSSSSDSSDSDSDDDDSSSSSSTSSSDGTNEFMSNSEISHLIDKCIFGLEICIVRLCQNYKALYRLAHVFFNYKGKKDLTRCKQLLLSGYKCKDGTVVSGLFSDRKPNNFFNGIWRIPSTEIDRPGSLSAHMTRCLSLLMQILMTTNDNKTLIDICVHLRKTPEPDKIYIKDSDRMAFSEQALTMSIQSIRGQIKDISNMSNPQIAKLLQEIFKTYQRLQKHVPGKEGPFANLLEEVYKKFIKEKIPENVNVLDLAIKFCLQNKVAEKQKLLGIKTLMFSPRGISTNTPVMPSPQTVIPSQSSHLKRPGTTRPRGRPPLNKAPGQVRYQRPKSPSPAGIPKQYSWQKPLMDHSYAYEYLKHYQDELIKQYSQNLSIAQLTQLSSILTQGQINNPITATAITSQMLAQTGLLNSNLLKQISSSGNVSQGTSAQLMDTLNQLNPNMKKKLGVDQALSNLTADQLKMLGTLVPKQQGMSQPKSSTSTTNTSTSGIVHSKQVKQQLPVQRHNSPSTSKSVIVDSSMNNPAISASLNSSPSKNLQSGALLFKEPTNTVSAQEDKTAKDLMKDRPNISITPVAVSLPPPPSVSPNFMRPASTSPSSGKTLQEKLADKKKEQQTKHMKSSSEEDKRQTDAFIKSLNIPSIPSSLTVSPAQPMTSPVPHKTSEMSSVFTFPKSSTGSVFSSSIFPVSSPTSTFPKSTPPSSTFLKSTLSSSTFPLSTPSTYSKPAHVSTFPLTKSHSTISKAVPSSSFSITSSSSSFLKGTSSSSVPMDISIQPSISSKTSKEQSFPASLMVTKASNTLPTPSFSANSGISISQVSSNQQRKIKERCSSSRDIKVKSSSSSEVKSQHENKSSNNIKPKKVKQVGEIGQKSSETHIPKSFDSVIKLNSNRAENDPKKLDILKQNKDFRSDPSKKSETQKKVVSPKPKTSNEVNLKFNKRMESSYEKLKAQLQAES